MILFNDTFQRYFSTLLFNATLNNNAFQWYLSMIHFSLILLNDTYVAQPTTFIVGPHRQQNSRFNDQFRIYCSSYRFHSSILSEAFSLIFLVLQIYSPHIFSQHLLFEKLILTRCLCQFRQCWVWRTAPPSSPPPPPPAAPPPGRRTPAALPPCSRDRPRGRARRPGKMSVISRDKYFQP